MKIRFEDSLYKYIPGLNEPMEIADKHRGKAARVKVDNERTLMLILPCGHLATLQGWEITNIDTDTPTAKPSIFCKGKPKGESSIGGDCWHGFLTEGELHQ